MKNILEIELFGEDTRQLISLYKGILNMGVPGLGDAFIGKNPASAWVAEIVGLDEKYKYARNFIKCKKDYSRSNSKGSRGIYAEYVLESGHIYEVKARVSWGRGERYFCILSSAGDIVKVMEEDVIEWLNNRLE